MQQPIHPIKNPIDAKIVIPGSKPLTHRAIIIAALTDSVSELSGISIDSDTYALVNALGELGIVIQVDPQTASCVVAGGNGRFPKNQTTVPCGNSTITAELLIPICGTLPGAYFFQGEPNVQSISLTSLLAELTRQYCQLIPNDARHLPLTLIGVDKLMGGKIVLDETISQTSISALLITAIYARSPISLMLPELNDTALISMTTSCMAEFGVLTHGLQEQMIMVPSPQFYHAVDYKIEPDYAIAGYFFAAAAITSGELSIKSANIAQSCQFSVRLLTILEKMGCEVETASASITVKGPQLLKGIDVSLRTFADTFATLAAIAVFADSPTRISHSGSMQKDELTLFKAVQSILVDMGIEIESGEDWLLIFPGNPQPTTVKTNNDSRLAMAFSLIGLKIPGVVIDNAECLDTVFPAFFNYWEKLSDKGSINA